MDSLIKKLLEKTHNDNYKKLTREEMIESLFDDEPVEKSEIESLIYRARIEHYKKELSKYLDSIKESVQLIFTKIDQFNSDCSKKTEILHEIISLFKKEKRTLINNQLYSRLEAPLEYALEIKDLDAAEFLLEKRMQISSDYNSYTWCLFDQRRCRERASRGDLLDSFIRIVAEKCDTESAEYYISKASKGKYGGLFRNEGVFITIGEERIREMYLEARASLMDKKEI